MMTLSWGALELPRRLRNASGDAQSRFIEGMLGRALTDAVWIRRCERAFHSMFVRARRSRTSGISVGSTGRKS